MKGVVLLSSLLLAGCAANWQRSGTTVAQADQDLRECKYEAERATPRSGGDPIAAGIDDGLRESRLRDQCMEIRGYRK
jgi:hypothetical protein